MKAHLCFFISTGITWAKPEGFGEAFACEYGAQLLTRKSLTDEIILHRGPDDQRGIETGIVMMNMFKKMVYAYIHEGRSVVTDMSFNTGNSRSSRRQAPLSIARRLGIRAVAFDFYAPEWKMIYRRRKSYEGIPGFKPPRGVGMEQNLLLERPTLDEGLDSIFLLDGGNDVPELMREIFLHMAHADLVKP